MRQLNQPARVAAVLAGGLAVLRQQLQPQYFIYPAAVFVINQRNVVAVFRVHTQQ